MSDDNMKLALISACAALAGGLVSGFLAGIYQHIRDWVGRPRLELVFDPNSVACKIDTAWKGPYDESAIDRIVIRVGVHNKGRKAAANCRVHLIALDTVVGSNSTPTTFRDSMVLPWAGKDFKPRDVPSVVNYYVDVVMFRKDRAGWDFTFEKVLSSQHKLKSHVGTYRFALVATADNAKPVTCAIDVEYRNDWNQVQAVKVSG